MLSDHTIAEILKDWSFWEELPSSEVTIPRLISLPKKLDQDVVLVIQGVRRCGKSTLLAQMPNIYRLPQQNCFFCNFEDPRLMNDLNHLLLTKIVSVARSKISSDSACFFFFDEIQNVKNWEKWLHVQLERPKNNYFVLTGSNSRLLSGEFATVLTGRHIGFELFPFSFAEFKQIFQDATIEDYLFRGGFPKASLYEHPYQLLQEYFSDIILRDVLKRVRARSPESIKQVAKMTFETCGSELSFRKIAAITGLTVDTVKSYLEACEDAYLLFSCPFFAFSEKKRLAKQKKYYPIDSGLRYAVTSIQGRDLGKSFELMVYLKLRQTHENVYYWQELHKGEVDFVGVNGNSIIPYQVTWNHPESRHEIALENFYQHFPQANEAVFISQANAHEFL